MMWERLVEAYGQETITDLVKTNFGQDLTAQGMQLGNAPWDTRDQIQVDPDGVDPDGVPDQPRGGDDA